MKKIFRFLAIALCSLFVLAACEPENNPSGNKPSTDQPSTDNPSDQPSDQPSEEEPGGTESEELVIPSPYFQGYYYADFNENGLGLSAFALFEGNIEFDEYDEIVGGSGTIAYIELTMPLSDNPDCALVPVGAYAMDENEEYALNTWSAYDSYVVKVEDGEIVYEYDQFTSGTVTVSKEGDNYKFVLDMTVGDDEFNMEYVGPAKLVNSSEEGEFSNLTADVEVKNLTKASMFCMGDIMEDGVTESWVISIGDQYYDLLTDYGLGYSMLLYFNLEPGLDGVPAGTYDTVIDVMDLLMGEQTIEPNTLLGGFASLGMYMGCYYMCPALTEEAALKSGSVTVAVDGDVYTISGKLYDGYENEVSFKYEGELERMVIEMDSMVESKATAGFKGMKSRPYHFNKKR